MKPQLFLSFILIWNSLNVLANEQDSQDEYLKGFAKVYGYVRYFYPGPEADSINWNRLAIAGAKEVIECKSDEDFLKALNALFLPIAPSINFTVSSQKPSGTEVADSTTINTIYWYHLGLGRGMLPSSFYSSKKISYLDSDTLNDLDRPRFGESIVERVYGDIWCQVPITIRNEDETSSLSIPGLIEFKEYLSKAKFDIKKYESRIANLIVLYNVLEHFHPMKEYVKTLDSKLMESFDRSKSDSTIAQHINTIYAFTNDLKDGHFNVNHPSIERFTPPLLWEWVEEKLVVTAVVDSSYLLSVGDVVSHVGSQTSEAYMDSLMMVLPGGSEGHRRYIANNLSLFGKSESSIIVTVEGKDFKLKRTYNPYESGFLKPFEHEPYSLKKEYAYIDLTKVTMDEFKQILPDLHSTKSIIFDLRGYANRNHEVLNYLMPFADTTEAWMYTPQIVRPGKQFKSMKSDNWKQYIIPVDSSLENKKKFLLIDAKAVSYSESIIGYFDAYNIATIIGQPSAGTNGVTNNFYLSGQILISWTGMKVTKHDGTALYSEGFKPDYLVEPTVSGITESHDEVLEFAIKMATDFEKSKPD